MTDENRIPQKANVSVYCGNTEKCWTNALSVERERASKRSDARWNKQHDEHRTKHTDRRADESLSADIKRKHTRAKKLVNYGKWSKAMRALLSKGTADINSNILSVLFKKQPPSKNPIVHAGPSRVGYVSLSPKIQRYTAKRIPTFVPTTPTVARGVRQENPAISIPGDRLKRNPAKKTMPCP